MGNFHIKSNHVKQICDSNVLNTTERDYLSKNRTAQISTNNKPSISPVRVAQLLLIYGYLRSNEQYCPKIPSDVVFVCYDFYILPINHLICFSLLNIQKPRQITPQKPAQTINITKFNQSNTFHLETQNITMNTPMKTLKENKFAICYVPNISDVSAKIKAETPAIIRCGQISPTKNHLTPKRLSFKNYNNIDSDYCSAIIFNPSYNKDNALHGIEIDLPTFQYSVCDDMIYYNNEIGVIAYQSFDIAPYNRLYYLNNKYNEWQLLCKVSWTALSAAKLCKMEKQNKLFITTKAGQSVVYSFDENTYIRTANMNITDGFDNIINPFKNRLGNSDLHSLTYNEAYNKIYRAINGNKYFEYSLHKNKWYNLPNMELFNNNNNKYFIDSQILFVNQQTPNVINSIFSVSTSYNNCKWDKFKTFNNANVYTAYFDQRDTSQKWNILHKTVNKNYYFDTMFI